VHFRRLRLILAAVLVTTALASPASADVAPESAVVEWNRLTTTALAQPPHVAVIHLAMVQGAVYDALTAIDGGYEPYAADLSAISTASRDAAVATAARNVLAGLGFATATIEAEYATSLADSLAAVGQANHDAGVAVGAAAAAAMLANRVGDGRYVPFTFRSGTGPGEWRPEPPSASDPNAWVANVRPFVLTSTSQFRSDGPLALTSAEYAAEYNEVKALGASQGSTRTEAQTKLADFYKANPVEMLNRTFRGMAATHVLPQADQARFLAMLNMAGADALINCWNDKNHYAFWRPSTAIRLGDTDGNDATVADPNWAPYLANPPYSDHPSGYNCLTGAMVHTASYFFGTNKVTFTMDSSTSTVDRTYVRFTDVVKDTIDARIYLGIHFRTPDVQGAIMGSKVARWLDRHYFQPAD
jgi:hypothetical protein